MTCKEIHVLVKSAKRFNYSNVKDKNTEIPKHGLYIMFEEGEKYGGLDRIVRIGTDTTVGDDKKGLFGRLKDHYGGNSVFCRHIGCCILGREGKSQSDIQKYYNREKGYTASKIKIDKDITLNIKDDKGNLNPRTYDKGTKLSEIIKDYIRGNISFCVVDIDNLQERCEAEKLLIEIVSKCECCQPSENWLGKNHFIDTIKSGKLYNIEHVHKGINLDNILNNGIVKKR